MSSAITTVAETFGKWANNHEDSYALSVPYYLLTGRKGTSIYSQGDASLVVCQHPHIQGRLMVFPEIGGDGTLTCKVLDALEAPANGIQLARYTDADLVRLTEASKDHCCKNGYDLYEIEEHVMDWKYPVHILNTERVASLTGGGYDKIRNKYNKVSEQLSVIPLSDPKANAIMRSSLMFWAGSMIYHDKETGHDQMEFYTTLFQQIEKTPEMYDGFTVLCEGEPAGFTIWDRSVDGIANGIASLSRIKVKGLSEFQTVTACAMLRDQGIYKYNIGGSETEGLHRHKLEYRPEKSIQLHSYEVIKKPALADISVQTLVP